MPVDLGFIENCESWRLESRFFPSKIGGKPAWLNLKHIPGKKELECGYCAEPCIFLCQVYAPYEENAAAFHRSIFLFVCKNPECCRANENKNFKVFRSQLEKVNDYYPSEPPEERMDWRPDITASNWVKTCFVCGIFAPNHCSKCKIANYCCRAHQVYHWKNGHKESCDIDNVISSTKFLFPEFELVSENEEYNDEVDDPDKEKKEIEKYQELVRSGKAGTFHSQEVDGDLIKMAHHDDETFSKFYSRIERYPDQVIRYDIGGQPLYISEANQARDVPNCSECNEERQFELQIMPQLLNFLNLPDSLKSLDWGIIAIFTCRKSCIPKTGYVEEYVWKQDIVPEEKNNDTIE